MQTRLTLYTERNNSFINNTNTVTRKVIFVKSGQLRSVKLRTLIVPVENDCFLMSCSNNAI